MAFLVWDSGEGRVVRELDRAVLIIGRDAVSDLRLDDPSVSRRHAIVQIDGAKVSLTDLGSTGGTKINGASLTPDLPSTLEPGDFVHIGRAVLTYHLMPPPAAATGPAPPPPPHAAKPARKRARAQSARPVASGRGGKGAGSGVWKWLAIGLAILVVGLAGALIVPRLKGNDSKPPEEAAGTNGSLPTRTPDPQPPPRGDGMGGNGTGDAAPDPDREKGKEAGTGTKPDTDPATEPERAPSGELPPRGYVSIKQCPYLLEVEGGEFYPLDVRDWAGDRVEGLGADGRLYAVAKVAAVMDRADLSRRAARQRARLDPDDMDRKLAFAAWCASRYIKREAAILAREVLKLRPGDPVAKALLETIGE